MPVENLLVDGNGPVFIRCSPLCTKYGAAREDSTNWHSISSGWGYDWPQSCNLLQCSIDILVADDVYPGGRHDRSPAQATPTMQQHRAPPNILANRIDDGVKTVRLQGPDRRNLSVLDAKLILRCNLNQDIPRWVRLPAVNLDEHAISASWFRAQALVSENGFSSTLSRSLRSDLSGADLLRCCGIQLGSECTRTGARRSFDAV